MASLSSLRDLSACWSIIFGKAQSYEGATSALEPSSGRPDFIDDKTEQMRSALSALRHLRSLFAIDEKAYRVLMISHILWGEESRKLKDNWVDLGRALRERVPTKNSATLRQKLWIEALEEYDKARKIWEAL